MAELTGLARKSFLDLFLPAYNRTHGTAYEGEPEEVEHQDWDYRWPGPTRRSLPLLVQHTRAGSNEREERAKRALAGSWTYSEIHEPLLAAGLKGFRLQLAVHSLPSHKRERAAMGAALRQTILHGLLQPLAIGERRELTPFSRGDGIAELVLEGVEPERSQISVTGPPFRYDAHLIAPRAIAALRKKQARLGAMPTEAVLAIFFDLTSYEDSDLAEMRSALETEGVVFREVWVVNPWQPGARADLVWPVQPAEDG